MRFNQIKIYYRGTDKQLRCFESSLTDHWQSINDVKEVLHDCKEAYMKPILALIGGGKV